MSVWRRDGCVTHKMAIITVSLSQQTGTAFGKTFVHTLIVASVFSRTERETPALGEFRVAVSGPFLGRFFHSFLGPLFDRNGRPESWEKRETSAAEKRLPSSFTRILTRFRCMDSRICLEFSYIL